MQIFAYNNVTIQKKHTQAAWTLIALNNCKNMHKSNNNLQINNLQV